jgi:hypothetical protein
VDDKLLPWPSSQAAESLNPKLARAIGQLYELWRDKDLLRVDATVDIEEGVL